MNGRRALGAAALAAAGVLGLSGPVHAQDVGGLQSKIAGAREQAQGLAEEIDGKSADLAAARQRADAAAARESELGGVLAGGRERAAELTQRVEAARAKADQARTRLGRAIDQLERRLVAIYKEDSPDATTLLLDADGYDDLVTRAEYLERIEDADADLVARVRELRAELERGLDEVSAARAEQEAFNRRLEQAQAQIAQARAAADARAAALADARAAQADSLDGLRSKIGGWTKKVQRAYNVSETQAQQRVGDWFGDWAIPEAIVMCESGGNFHAVNPSSGAGGAYQILPSTWRAYGGKGLPQDAPPAEQHRIAAQIWADSGGSAWVCAG